MQPHTLLHSYTAIVNRIDAVDVTAYAKTRNYTNGAVSYLSPYISRGVVTLPFVLQRVLQRYTATQAHTFIFELAWREYFKRQWYQLGAAMFTDVKQPQQGVQQHGVPAALVNATTGIQGIDEAINGLYRHGYMHNHVRMYTASVACNIAHAHWLLPARWLYYHLADHDLASNHLSWQWVAGTFSSKRYYCDQQNINTYTGTTQRNTFLDVPYPMLPHLQVPGHLQQSITLNLQTPLPVTPLPVIDTTLPLLLYNSYNLNPLWRSHQPANRVLLLEPSHFHQYPVSENSIAFILQLAGNIPGLQVYCGEVADLPLPTVPAVYSMQHPAFTHYPGVHDEPEWLFPQVAVAKGSFMNYWEQCSRYLPE